jgi:hypothetical protein
MPPDDPVGAGWALLGPVVLQTGMQGSQVIGKGKNSEKDDRHGGTPVLSLIITKEDQPY